MVPDPQKVRTDGMDGRTDDVKIISLRLRRGDNKYEGNRAPQGKRKLYCTLTKDPENYISHFL